MPTSATGARPLRDAGFTLVELMVVLLILGLAGAAVVLTAPDPGPRPGDAAEALAARLRRAQEEAVLTNRAVEVVLTPDGYAFRVQRRGAWEPLDEAPFTGQAWPDGLQVQLSAPSGRQGVRFDPTGAADPAVVTFRSEARRTGVSVDAAGNVRIDGQPG